MLVLTLWKAAAQETGTFSAPYNYLPNIADSSKWAQILAASEKICGFIHSLWNKSPTVGKSLRNNWGNLDLDVSQCAEITKVILL